MINYELKFKVSEMSKILKVEKDLIKNWAYQFAEFLSPNANPKKGNEREFTVEDISTLTYISYYWEENPDFENIKFGLNGGDQFKNPFSKLAIETIPIFREYSNDILTKNVWMIGGMASNPHILALADSYKTAADILVDAGIEDIESNDLIYPAIFNYRHSTELYLKAFLSDYKNTHKLNDLYSKFKILIKDNFNEETPIWLENIIIAFDEFDPYGTSFRYGDKLYQNEIFVDLIHLKKMMDWLKISMNKIDKTFKRN